MIPLIKKELLSYFTTMTGYIFLSVFVITTGYYFVRYSILNLYYINGYADYGMTIFSTIFLFLLLIPMLTMRLFADEKKQNTDQLLYTSPVTLKSIVLGKFLGAVIVFLIGFAITLTFPLFLSYYVDVPFAKTFTVSIGFCFLIISFISVGVFISCLTENPIISAVVTFCVMFMMLFMDGIITSLPTSKLSSVIFLLIIMLIISIILFDSTKDARVSFCTFIGLIIFIIIIYFLKPTFYDALIYKTLKMFSPVNRVQNFSIGMLSIGDIIYYITFIIAFIYLTINTLEKRRWK